MKGLLELGWFDDMPKIKFGVRRFATYRADGRCFEVYNTVTGECESFPNTRQRCEELVQEWNEIQDKAVHPMICPYCQDGKIAVTLMDHSGSYSMCRRCAIHWGLKLQDVTTLDDPAPTQTKPLTPTEEIVLLEQWAKVEWPVN